MAKRNLASDMASAGRSKRARSGKSVSRSYIAKTTRQVVLRMAEKKVATTAIAETTVSSASQGSTWVSLSNISQGTGHGSRVGREIRLDNLKIDTVIHNNSTGTHLVRVVIGYMLDQTIPGLTTEVFEGGNRSAGPDTFGTGSSNQINAMIQPLNKAKFRPIYDKVIKVGATGSVDGSQVKHWKISKKLGGTKIRFEADSSGAANQDKALYVGAWTAEGGNDVGVGTAVEWHLFASLAFTDL